MYLLDHPVAFFVALVALLLVVVEIGFRFASRSSVNEDSQHHEQIVAARDGIGVLLSLLLGFTLAMGLPRFEQRKQLIVDEANDIGTTILRAQALPDPAGAEERALLRQYLDARMAYSQDGLSPAEIQASLQRASALQTAMWDIAAELAKKNPTTSTGLFMQTLNDTIDVSEKRTAAREYRVPPAVWIMLVVMSALTCLTVGYGMAKRLSYVMLLTPLMIAIVLTLVVDLDSPRTGFIRVEQPSMERLRDSLRQSPAQPPEPQVK